MRFIVLFLILFAILALAQIPHGPRDRTRQNRKIKPGVLLFKVLQDQIKEQVPTRLFLGIADAGC